jgi:hypothetical protein
VGCESLDLGRGDGAVAVYERDRVDVGVDDGRAGVAGARRATIDGKAHEPGAVPRRDGRDRVGVDRPVVDDDDLCARQRGEAPIQCAGAVPDRYDAHHPARRPRCGRRSRMRQSRGDEPARECPVTAIRHRAAIQQRGGTRRTRRRQAQQPPRRAAPQQQPVRGPPQVGVGRDAEAGRKRPGHRARPPSTATSAPVIALLCSLASQTIAAATSSGSSNRPMGCCSTKSAVSMA